MQTENDEIENAMSAFKPDIWKQDGQFFLHEKSMAILVSDGIIADAHEKYLAELRSRLESYQQAGALHLCPGLQGGNDVQVSARSRTVAADTSVLRQLGIFAAKLGVLAVLALFILQIGSGLLASRIEASAKNAFSSVASGLLSEARSIDLNLVSRARGVLNQTAEHFQGLSDEKREVLRRDLDTLAKALKPFVDGLVEDGSKGTESPPPK